MVTRVVRRIGRSEPEEVQDAVQEVFLHLFKALRNYDPSRSVEAYILEIARRVGISRLRKASAAKRGGMNPCLTSLNAHGSRDEAGFLILQSPCDDQETSLIRAQETRFLRKALNSLSEACRQLLELRYEQGLSYKEIANELHVREGTLRVQVQRCLSSLSRGYAKLVPQEVGTP
jgi:RNA polymerase sigma-70 factor, ECF subfamily